MSPRPGTMYQLSSNFSSIEAVTRVMSGWFSLILFMPSGAEITVKACIFFGLYFFTVSMANDNEPPVAYIGSKINTFLSTKSGSFS